MSRPGADTYPIHFAHYVEKVPDGAIDAILADQGEVVLGVLGNLASDQWRHRYAPDKWSVKEVLGHLIDCERIFATRALRFARGDTTPVPGFDQDDYIAHARFDERAAASLLEEYRHLRSANLAMFASFDSRAADRRGVADGHPLAVKAIPWIVAGHERHHLDVLRERYDLRDFPPKRSSP